MLHFGYGSNLSIKAVHEDLKPECQVCHEGILAQL